ncbi:hypothetical protein RF11_09690 [Thelohanellus kitauei]|uniref:Uncharacterized protein n=1 Tax=Thelohanellus kitauei TaxID=669202 RepID=A0A0C2N918_THEKT|nr:hypothetical protein RF11_09690 [Thelohanellus kitauei]
MSLKLNKYFSLKRIFSKINHVKSIAGLNHEFTESHVASTWIQVVTPSDPYLTNFEFLGTIIPRLMTQNSETHENTSRQTHHHDSSVLYPPMSGVRFKPFHKFDLKPSFSHQIDRICMITAEAPLLFVK